MVLTAAASDETRLKALQNLDILDSPSEEQFDRITRMAARVFDVPVAEIHFIGRTHQWTKSSVGRERKEVAREDTFCNRTIQSQDLLVVQDATQEEAFKNLPAVKDKPPIKFYAGAPLINQDGVPLGTLCIFDYQSRTWDEDKAATLRELADVVEDELRLRQAGQTIRKSERHYRRLFEESRDAILLTTPEGAFLDANPATLKLFGYSQEELMDLNVQQLWANPERRNDYQRQMHEEGAIHDFEVELKRKDGSTLYCQVTATARRDEHDKVTAYQDIVRDVTDRKRREQQIKILNQILRHDVRNDANVIIAWASMLKQKTDEQYREFIQYIEMASRRVVQLTNSARELMETINGDEALELETINLTEILTNEVNKVNTSYTSAEVYLEDPLPDTLYVRANPMLSSVFGNLLHNAIQHNNKDQPKIWVSLNEHDDTIVVSVSDNGPGVNDDQKKTVFGKGKKGLKTQGTGIGLYLVKTLVEHYGGAVQVRDNDIGGAIFDIGLHKAESDVYE